MCWLEIYSSVKENFLFTCLEDWTPLLGKAK
jgi:hypothetical protein